MQHPADRRRTPPVPRARVIVPSDDDRRPVDLELSAEVHRSLGPFRHQYCFENR
ncbi:hypothetical protein Cfla_0382 [Cellulomonas flavigena DSM 20109]|uniref:Uncharacterized protein n=1 Tax=Cellulomonas flavigena (strain ATCC 482 / DSM 20109 / BCRC 11376 / JCM 18109 / NBRC 3775 / NCIMB 8073 / NRS 134) TaxID=446466 RepID=D5UH96_CELFN|nr:hypothetical protein [Cellulomonas flavigena]ADG73299.1 hypothetical protein Cfla_0382 [Cellulomonas flavigena DSM 20109]